MSAVYALSILPGYALLYLTAAREFRLSAETELLAVGRDLSIGVAAFAFGRNLAGQISNPSPLVEMTVAGGAAFLAAAVLLTLVEPKFFRTILKYGSYQRSLWPD